MLVCGSQREKAKIVALQARKKPHRQQKSRARNESLLSSRFIYMGVFSDDFAAVDLREVLCYHSRPEKRKFRGTYISIRVQKV